MTLLFVQNDPSYECCCNPRRNRHYDRCSACLARHRDCCSVRLVCYSDIEGRWSVVFPNEMLLFEYQIR
jgi:hypothetical protein